jgi:uncharacterized protein YyaL (SSP411 family)
MPVVPPPPAWADWDNAAFSRAAAERKPVLLYLFATWSSACAELDAALSASRELQDLVADAFVAVRVDVDLRPDIAERYGLGSWPSVLVLTPEGHVLTGGRRLDAPEIALTLARVAAAFRDRRTELLESARHRPAMWPTPAGGGHDVDRSVVGQFLEYADAVLARGPTLVRPRVVEACLAIGELSDDGRGAALAAALLDAALHSLLDRRAGGMFRPPDDRMGAPEPVMLLASNAAYTELLLRAAPLVGRPDFREHGARLAACLRDQLAHRVAGFVHAYAPPLAEDDDDVPPRNAGRDEPSTASGGRPPGRPRSDLRRFVDGNAAAARALLHAAGALDEPALGELAVQTIEHVVLAGYQRGTQLAHVVDPMPRLRGMLGDQVTASAALIAAFDATGMRVYLDLAEELVRSVLRAQWDPGRAALRDRAAMTMTPAGPLDTPFFPFASNCLAARVLAQLTARTAEPEFLARAREMLGSWAPVWSSAAPDPADYVIALIETHHIDDASTRTS